MRRVAPARGPVKSPLLDDTPTRSPGRMHTLPATASENSGSATATLSTWPVAGGLAGARHTQHVHGTPVEALMPCGHRRGHTENQPPCHTGEGRGS